MKVVFTPGRVDTTQDLTDVETFAYRTYLLPLHRTHPHALFAMINADLSVTVEPKSDGFRNYGSGTTRDLPEEILVDKASQLSLSPPELTVLVGGLRALNANFDGSSHGIFTNRPGKLTNDYFTNLLSSSTVWSPIANSNDALYEGKDLKTGKVKYTATRVDLVFGSHPELRAVSEFYGAGDGQAKLVRDFAKAWSKVMDLDRYDIKGRKQNNVQ